MTKNSQRAKWNTANSMLANAPFAPDKIFPHDESGINDLSISDIEMLEIRFVPTVVSKSTKLNVKYKQFLIPFDRLPVELQQQLKQFVFERISKQLEQEKLNIDNRQ